MAVRNKSNKTSKRAELDVDFVPYANSKKSKKNHQRAIYFETSIIKIILIKQ